MVFLNLNNIKKFAKKTYNILKKLKNIILKLTFKFHCQISNGHMETMKDEIKMSFKPSAQDDNNQLQDGSSRLY